MSVAPEPVIRALSASADLSDACVSKVWDPSAQAVAEELRGPLVSRRYGVCVDAEGRRRVAVEHALTMRRPKARYLVGPDAKAYGHVLTRLPDALTDLGSRRWERRGRKARAPHI